MQTLNERLNESECDELHIACTMQDGELWAVIYPTDKTAQALLAIAQWQTSRACSFDGYSAGFLAEMVANG